MEWYAATGVLNCRFGAIRGVDLALEPGVYELRLGYSVEENSSEQDEETIIYIDSVELYRDGVSSPLDSPLEGDAASEIYRAYMAKIPAWLESGGIDG